MTYLLRFTLLFFVFVFGASLSAQIRQSVMYTFDDCDGADIGSIGAAADVQGNPECDCGVIGDALVMDGNNDRILIPDTVRSLFDDDFSVSFYFQSRNIDNTTDIFSYRTTCDVDSALSIKYIPVSHSMRIEIAENFNNILELRGFLNKDACWHNITVTKFNLQYSLFIDGMIADQVLSQRQVPFGKNAKIWIGNSPCLAFTEERLFGKFDELEITNYALTFTEVGNAYVSPDRILTPDTTIFTGEQVQIRTGPSCAEIIQWNPGEGLNATDLPDPIVTGVVTTSYAVTFSDPTCVARDTIMVNVVDPDALKCDDLLLPKAFTPNDDSLNDVYLISNGFIIQELISFEIFDRLGERIYMGSNKRAGWDGTYNGEKVNPGMYLYKITYTCDGLEYVKLDNFTVLR
jgi:gliding motility-associated-like protein